jgi:hypothetical protein
MSMHGQVHTWVMTEEERQAYIKKHPIVPTERPKGATFYDVNERQRKKTIENRAKGQAPVVTVMDKVDQEKLHQLYLDGKKYSEMADILDISVSTLNNFIVKQRRNNPEKWPNRIKK